MIVELTTWQRVQMRAMFYLQPHGASYLEGEQGSDFLDALELSAVEQAEIDFRPQGAGGQWNIDKDRMWQIELEPEILIFAFGRLLHPQAGGWAYDKVRNEAMVDKMKKILKDIRESALPAGP
jgi:hypothetical protein